MKHTILFLILITGILAGMPACKKWVYVAPPPSAVVRVKVFDSDAGANAAVVGMYAEMVQGQSFSNGHGSKATALYTDELIRTTVGNPIADLHFYTGLQVTNPTIESFWSRFYAINYTANAILEGLKVSEAVSDSLRYEMNGEARFVRALNYYYLVNLFGEVPLVLSTDAYNNRYLPRSPVNKVYDQIVEDLDTAISLLPASRQHTDTTKPGNIRATKWAAKALLARVYLCRKQWANAEAMAASVIENGPFSLPGDLSQVFLIGSPEIIFQLQPVTAGNNSGEGALFIPASGMPPCTVTPALLQSFEPGDKRKDAWMNAYLQGKDTFFYPAKYKTRTSTSETIREYTVQLRLAEMYLVRAEANARLNTAQATINARAGLNQLRARAKLTTLPVALNGQALINVIEHERQVELFTECGHRLFDLRRMPGIQSPAQSRLQEVMIIQKPATWKSHYECWPIPADQVRLNDGLQQNPGY